MTDGHRSTRIPMKDGMQNWDCLEAIDQEAFITAIDKACATGPLPVELPTTAQSTNSTAKMLTVADLQRMDMEKAKFSKKLPRYVFIDGFMLLNDPEVVKRLDLAFILRATLEVVRQRRQARGGYQTIEGSWQDPPQYIEQIMWPEYVRYHSQLFCNGDVEGKPKEFGSPVNQFSPEPNMDLSSTAQWVVRTMLSSEK